MFSDDMVALFGAFLEGDDREYVRHGMANLIVEGYASAS